MQPPEDSTELSGKCKEHVSGDGYEIQGFLRPSSKYKPKDPDVIRQFFEKFLMTGEQTSKEYRVQAMAEPGLNLNLLPH